LLPEGGYRPIENKFELAKRQFQLDQTTYLDTTSIYVRRYLSGIDNDSTYCFFRFFGNGRVFWSKPFDQWPVSNEEVNNLPSGNVGYYELTNRNEIALEFFLPDASGNPYYTFYGRATGDSIVIDLEENRYFTWPWQKKKDRIEMDYPLKLLRYQPEGLELYSRPDW
jgi:hypothetical protein